MSARRAAVKMLQAARLNKVAHKIYYTYLHDFESASSALPDALQRCFEEAVARGIADTGDYLEFGLFKGYSFWCAQDIANRMKLKDMRFFGFDSFAGLPEVQSIDRTSRNEFYKGQYACPKEAVLRNLDAKGVDWNRTYLIEGFFHESLTEDAIRNFHMERASIALIDCDLYASTADVLKFLETLIPQSAILVFDDWNCFDADDSRGQRKAFRGFLDANPHFSANELFSYGQHGQVFVVDNQAVPENTARAPLS